MERVFGIVITGIIILYCAYVLYETFVITRRARNNSKNPPKKPKNKIKNIFEKFKDEKPRCLEGFDIEDCPGEVANSWLQGPEFLSKLVKCKCGESELYVYASSNDEMLLAPIYLECPKCLTKDLIFDPTIHGWDGENGDSASLVGGKEPKKINSTPRRIIVNYSFQGEENYADLMDDGIKNPQDYFDVFIINTLNVSGELEEVVSYECA